MPVGAAHAGAPHRRVGCRSVTVVPGGRAVRVDVAPGGGTEVLGFVDDRVRVDAEPSAIAR